MRFSEDLLKRITLDSKDSGFESVNQWLVEASKHFLTCKVADTARMRVIVLKYPATCLMCHKHLERFTYALYGQGVGAICLDCYVKKIGDKALVAKDIKLRELKQLILAYTREKDRLADEVEVLMVADKFRRLEQMAYEQDRAVMTFLKEKIGTPEEQEALLQLNVTNKKFKELLKSLEAFLERKLKRKTKVKQEA